MKAILDISSVWDLREGSLTSTQAEPSYIDIGVVGHGVASDAIS